ncbi:TPA: ATP-binding cassette domain-containing protein [Escherichia coli]|jgi:putative ABC transport system ATP-binding protein|nr:MULTISPECIES: ATP-binding cassette domain-containing protein [Enterobacteriaceae]MDU3762003.1 ATP-binding cassette domain-containing protein [Bacteroides sp.]EFG6464551.1 ATP-binding cassette domain-containing protein [Escherichia coli]EFI4242936.1 ATP-binding cassette domain-containing protein [Escherichia coli]EGE4564385.1 ATP-binding cassette domain-containing protein [Escherichia coli]EJD4921073.1 ATP-binding cassette domain-containing protein [Escherichia coli]
MINLTLRNKSFHGRDILTNHNLSFSQDGFYVIMGPSGVGKSTLLNIIGLLDLEFNGEYLFYGNNINAKNLELAMSIRRNHFGFIFQDSLINEKQSIIRNLLCSVDYSYISEAEKNTHSVLDYVGLHLYEGNASNLSGGEKQRLALARALIKKPNVLLADEPTASLDMKNKKHVMDILKEYNNKNNCIIMITHDIELVNDNMEVIYLNNRI